MLHNNRYCGIKLEPPSACDLRTLPWPDSFAFESMPPRVPDTDFQYNKRWFRLLTWLRSYEGGSSAVQEVSNHDNDDDAVRCNAACARGISKIIRKAVSAPSAFPPSFLPLPPFDTLRGDLFDSRRRLLFNFALAVTPVFVLLLFLTGPPNETLGEINGYTRKESFPCHILAFHW